MNHTQGSHFGSSARVAANIKRICSAKLSIAIAVILLTVTVCSLGIRAELRGAPFPARAHEAPSNLESLSSPQMRSNQAI
jgi:hypothetical protein